MTAISENIKTAQAIPVIIEEEEDLVPTVTSEGEIEEELLLVPLRHQMYHYV